MNHQEKSGDATLEGLLALVEKAVGMIEHLQDANASLKEQLRLQTAAAQDASAGLAQARMQIQEMEQATEAMRRDAEWCRWFRGKYGGTHFSTFYWHIEKEYRAEHPEAAAAMPPPGAAASPAAG